MPEPADQIQPLSLDAPQFAWQDGALHIQTLLSHMRIRWKPTPLAEEQLPFRPWAAFHPEIRLFRPPESPPPATAQPDPKQQAFDAFRAEVPADLVTLVDPFASHQWALLTLMASHPPAIDLARSNPILAYCLANNDIFRNVNPGIAAEQAVWYSNRKQRAILKWLGFPDTESMVRTMRKIQPEAVDPMSLRSLRIALSTDPSLSRRLAHLPCINRTMFGLLVNNRLRLLVSPKLMTRLAESTDEPMAELPSDRLIEALRLYTMLAMTHPIQPFDSLDQIDRFLNDLDVEYQARQQRRLEEEQLQQQRRAEYIAEQHRRGVPARRLRRLKPIATDETPFPPPPIPGTPDIIPLCRPVDLTTEGIEQKNCVGCFISMVQAGNVYIYRVLAPERATLSISRCPDGSWRRNQLRGTRNKPIHKATITAVESWLFKYRLSIN
ncbi:MAG: hypothetical protein A2498_01770 [Lentisphaerae bacterium RIFOXYC12_FULL_60_16]|nr:MAG: hypothetical protein A2498_01770 [Lentisphaerae bacterium RIFOXYC12_FULL_60_16]